MISEHVELLFDPQKSGEEIQAVFADDMARLLWLTCRQHRLASQFFNGSCLRYAKIVEKYKAQGKLDAEMLFRILSGFARPPMDGIIGPGERAFAIELMPFIYGKKTITFEIKKNK